MLQNITHWVTFFQESVEEAEKEDKKKVVVSGATTGEEEAFPKVRPIEIVYKLIMRDLHLIWPGSCEVFPWKAYAHPWEDSCEQVIISLALHRLCQFID